MYLALYVHVQICEYIQLLARLLEHAVLQGQCHEIVTSASLKIICFLSGPINALS